MDSLDSVLAQCLDDIETNKATVEECLRRHPEYAEALRPLLRTAYVVRQTPAVEPSAAFQAGAQTRLANLIAARPQAIPEHPAPHSAALRRWSLLLVRAAAVIIVASAFLAGTAYAARGSLPTSPLYPVKRTVEQMQVAIAPDDARRAHVLIQLMDQRAEETAVMLKAGHLERSQQTSLQYIKTLRNTEVIVERTPVNRPEGRQLLFFMRERLLVQQAAFQRIMANTPERGKPAIRPILNHIQRTIDRINMRLDVSLWPVEEITAHLDIGELRLAGTHRVALEPCRDQPQGIPEVRL